MNLIYLFSIYFLISPAKAFYSNHVEKNDDLCGKWEELTSEHGVKTYVRWLCKDDVKSVRERKGEFTVECTVDKAAGILTDPSATKKWMAGVSENYKISQTSEAVWHTYTLFNVPWPFDKRALISAYELKHITNSKNLIISITSSESPINNKQDVQYLTNYKAKWIVKEIDLKQVQISFSAISNDPPIFPRYIQDPVIERMFHNNLVRLKDLLSVNIK